MEFTLSKKHIPDEETVDVAVGEGKVTFKKMKEGVWQVTMLLKVYASNYMTSVACVAADVLKLAARRGVPRDALCICQTCTKVVTGRLSCWL